MKINLADFSGLAIRVAVIDTGLDVCHPYFNMNFDGQCVEINKCGQMSWRVKTCEGDLVGHGTACAGIIHKKAPNAKITSVRAIGSDMIGDAKRILDALEWCIDQAFDVVNLSLGTFSDLHTQDFITLGEYAKSKDVILVAASDDNSLASIPARLDSYIGVSPGRAVGPYTYYKRDGEIDYVCNGSRQRLAWKNGKTIFLNGSSFAAAHMTGIVVLLREIYPSASLDKIRALLDESASDFVYVNSVDVEESEAYVFNNAGFQINQAVLYPYTKEMHNVVRFQDLLPFSIAAIADIKYKGLVGKIPDEAKEAGMSHLQITSDLERVLQGADTLILSKSEMLGSLTGKDYLRFALRTAVQNANNVFSLEYVDCNMFPDVFMEACKKNVCIRHPMLGKRELAIAQLYKESFGHVSNSTPIIGVFGTGVSQGKFTVQLMLRSLFTKAGYRIANLGTETHSELFGFESVFPLEMDRSVCFSKWEMIGYLQGEIRRLELHHPAYDLIVVGCQSGVVPHSFAFSTDTYTLPSIAFLFGTLPHSYILTVNIQDEEEYVRDTIKALTIFGKGQTILLVFSTMLRENKIYRQMSENEISDAGKMLEKRYGIPATDVLSKRGQEKLMSTVIRAFS